MILATLIRTYRVNNKISFRKMAKIIGVDASTLLRFETGKAVSGRVLSAILRWAFSTNTTPSKP